MKMMIMLKANAHRLNQEEVALWKVHNFTLDLDDDYVNLMKSHYEQEPPHVRREYTFQAYVAEALENDIYIEVKPA